MNQRAKDLSFLFGAAIISLFMVGSVVAEGPNTVSGGVASDSQASSKSGQKEKKPEKVTTGVIASYGDYGRDASISAATTGAPGEDTSAISGSVSKLAPGKCQAVVISSAKDTGYSISFAVQGFDNKGNQTSRRTWSSTIKPKEKITKEFYCMDNELSFQVKLSSARPLK